jgi:hypothetical protein
MLESDDSAEIQAIAVSGPHGQQARLQSTVTPACRRVLQIGHAAAAATKDACGRSWQTRWLPSQHGQTATSVMTAVSKHVAMTELRAPWFDSLASHTKANATVTWQLPRQERR